MCKYRYSPLAASAAVALAALLAPTSPVRGQERSVLSNQVEVSAGAASLRLEFSEGPPLSVAFGDGRVVVDGQVVGDYQPGGRADQAWRELLAAVLPLSDGPLAQELARWSPSPGLPEADLALLNTVDRAIDAAVAGASGDLQRTRIAPAVVGLLEILSSDGRFGELGAALEGVDLESMEVVLDDDRVVVQGESVHGSVLVAGSELKVHGRIAGHAILVDGVLVIEEGGTVEGDARVVDGRVEERGGTLRGDVVDLLRESDANRSQDMDRVRHEMREQVRQEVRREIERDRSRSRGGLLGSRGPVARALGDLFEAVATFVVLALAMLLMARIAGERVDAVTEAIGHNPARSAAVGFAGGFLMLPVYVVGIVLLAVSIVGIPLLLAWAPLFPLAVVAAGFAGYVGVSHHVGRWVLRQDLAWLARADARNPVHVKLVGMAALLAPFPVAGVLRVFPVVGWTGSVVHALGVLGCFAAVIVGLGAVLITRGGRYPASSYAFADALDDLGAHPDWPDQSEPPDAPSEDAPS